MVQCREPRERGFVARIDELRRQEESFGRKRVAFGEPRIGLQSQRGWVFWIHLERLVGHPAGRGRIEFRQREHPPPDQRLDRARIDLESLVERIARVGAVVLFQKEKPGLRLGLPTVRIGLERVLVHFVQDERELRRLIVPARVFRAGEADEQEEFRVGDVLPGGAGVGIGFHEPAHFLVGRGDVALVAQDANADPACDQVRVLLLDRRFRVLRRVVPLAKQEEEIGALCEKRRNLPGAI